MVSKQKHLTLTKIINLFNFLSKRKCECTCTHANKFGIGRTQATDLIRYREMILKLSKSHSNDQMKTIKRCKTESINTNEVIYKWFCAARATNIPINGPILKEKALKVKNLNVKFLKRYIIGLINLNHATI